MAMTCGSPTKRQTVNEMSETANASATVQLEPHQVILRPLVTEKGVHRATRHNAYAFEVHQLANKLDIRRAVEELFNVKVVDVRTQNRLGKARRFRNRQGATRTWKKAIVKLAADNRIDFF
jgi:large subunit ribosomal protein L23